MKKIFFAVSFVAITLLSLQTIYANRSVHRLVKHAAPDPIGINVSSPQGSSYIITFSGPSNVTYNTSTPGSGFPILPGTYYISVSGFSYSPGAPAHGFRFENTTVPLTASSGSTLYLNQVTITQTSFLWIY
ncbi:hypothetical protein SAMN05421821_101553 [Mucilaginibacter lappiensis]|nr:hypothetical protein SAMN05421821_101553 [Mucilaginibacter lappiensis]